MENETKIINFFEKKRSKKLKQNKSLCSFAFITLRSEHAVKVFRCGCLGSILNFSFVVGCSCLNEKRLRQGSDVNEAADEREEKRKRLCGKALRAVNGETYTTSDD